MVWQIGVDEGFAYDGCVNYGIFYLNIKQAGDYLAKALIYEGYIEYNLPDNFDYDFFDANFSKEISAIVNEHEGYIVTAIQNKILKAKKVYNIKGEIDNNKTFINIFDLNNWLNDVDINIGDTHQDMVEKFLNIQEKVVETILIERMKLIKYNNELLDSYKQEKSEDKYFKYMVENIELKKNLKNMRKPNLPP